MTLDPDVRGVIEQGWPSRNGTCCIRGQILSLTRVGKFEGKTNLKKKTFDALSS